MPARAHRDSNPASNLVMLPGVTITSDGDLPGYPAANAILNAPRTPDANGYQVVFSNSWQGAAVYDANARQHLTITFPSPVTIKGIAWNSGGCENGFYGGGVWSATLDGHMVVSNKTITVGGEGGFMHVPYGADPGTQHEIATFSPATGTQLVLEFPVTARGSAYNYSIRDINIEPYVAATALIDRSSMTNKVMCGYQGWFLCPGDGSASWWGWNHWSKQADYIGPGTYNTDIWPDTREYDSSDLFPLPAGTTLTNGGAPYLFSSARQGAVNVHFRWMQENGIDGVFHQVFVGGYNPDPNDDVERKLDTVLQNVMNASSAYGRVFALEYDISGVSDADIYNKLTGHWTYVCSAFDLKNQPLVLVPQQQARRRDMGFRLQRLKPSGHNDDSEFGHHLVQEQRLLCHRRCSGTLADAGRRLEVWYCLGKCLPQFQWHHTLDSGAVQQQLEQHQLLEKQGGIRHQRV